MFDTFFYFLNFSQFSYVFLLVFVPYSHFTLIMEEKVFGKLDVIIIILLLHNNTYYMLVIMTIYRVLLTNMYSWQIIVVI